METRGQTPSPSCLNSSTPQTGTNNISSSWADFTADANPVIKESFAKQLLRSKRQERPMKAGHPDEPMRVSFIRAGRRRRTKQDQN